MARGAGGLGPREGHGGVLLPGWFVGCTWEHWCCVVVMLRQLSHKVATENQRFQGSGATWGPGGFWVQGLQGGALPQPLGVAHRCAGAAHRVGSLCIRAWVQGLCGGICLSVRCAHRCDDPGGLQR